MSSNRPALETRPDPAANFPGVRSSVSSEESTDRRATLDAAFATTPMMTARQANALSDTIREAMFQSADSRRRDGAQPIPYIETDLFHLQLRRQMVMARPGRELLRRPATEVLSEEMATRLARHFNMPAKEIPCSRVADQSADELARALDVDVVAARQVKLACLGVLLGDTDSGDTAHSDRRE